MVNGESFCLNHKVLNLKGESFCLNGESFCLNEEVLMVTDESFCLNKEVLNLSNEALNFNTLKKLHITLLYVFGQRLWQAINAIGGVENQVGNRAMSQVLYVVRHCQATRQEPDPPLTEIGQQQAIALVDWLADAQIKCIISSPFSPFIRAYQSIVPLAERLCLSIKGDDQLVGRVLSPVPLNDW